MDEAYTKHSSESRRKNKSQTNLSLSHLSLAPLTSKLPLPDHDELPDLATAPLPYSHPPSYLQGKSAPTTPRLLSRSPARSRPSSRPRPRRRSSSVHDDDAAAGARLPKSKSSSHLHGLRRRDPSLGALATPALASRRRHADHGHFGARDGSDSDWLLHAGAFISTETREGKGQAWLVSRASTTSLAGAAARDVEEEAYERELARERELAGRRGGSGSSRRGSFNGDDYFFTPSHRLEGRPHGSGGRIHPKTPLRTPLRTPMAASLEHQDQGAIDYFAPRSPGEEEHAPGPDFVSLDEKLEAIEGDSGQADEVAIRRLLKGDRAGVVGTWVGTLLGWTLFSVEENDEESDDDDNADGEMTDGETDASSLSRSASTKSLHGITDIPAKEGIPPPKTDEGGWHDAAWLLSVASKVLL